MLSTLTSFVTDVFSEVLNIRAYPHALGFDLGYTLI